MSEFRATLAVFEGPMDLLLTLIRREELDITTVALAKVTDQYLDYLSRLEAIDPGAIAAFCEVASSLMLIKSRALLPREKALQEDEDAEALELVARLRAYRRYKEVAQQLEARQASGLRAFAREAPPPEIKPQAPVTSDLGPADLAAAFESALTEALAQAAEQGDPADAGLSNRPRIRLADRFVQIRDLLRSRERVSFREILLGGAPPGIPQREFVIVSFLAVLELLRRRLIRALQSELFGDIDLASRPEAEGWDRAEAPAFVGDGDADHV